MSQEFPIKNILIISPGFPADENDMDCLPAQQSLILSFKEINPNLHITIVALEYPFSKEPYIWNGITVIPISGKRTGIIQNAFIGWKIWKIVKQLNRQNKIGGILSFWSGKTMVISHFIAVLLKIPHINWVLGQDANKGNRYFRWIKGRATQFAAISDHLADLLETNYSIKPTAIIPNAIYPKLFQLGISDRHYDIIGAGSLIPLKQYVLFISLINEMKEVYPSLKVILCGEGPEMMRLHQQIKTYRLEEIITLTGKLPPSEVFDLMQQSKIFLHTSAYEGFSGACLEALYAGNHVISFLQPMNGWLRNWHVVQNKEDMKNLLVELLNNKSLDHRPSLPYLMKDSALQMLSLFQN